MVALGDMSYSLYLWHLLVLYGVGRICFSVTGYSMYTAFGPGSKDLRDPFEDHGAIRFQVKLVI